MQVVMPHTPHCDRGRVGLLERLDALQSVDGEVLNPQDTLGLTLDGFARTFGFPPQRF